MSLYRPDELLSVKAFLRQQFGRDYPEQHEASTWRLAETKQMLGSAPFAITNYFRVADKDGNLTTIKPFVGQAILSVAIESQRRRSFPQRVIECKPRQIGWTTWCLGEALHTVLHPNRKAMVLVNDEDVAGAKATIIATMLNGLPGHLQPMRRIQNLKHLFFDNPNPKERIYDPGLNSELLITVPSGMRGSTPHIVIISEYAHMDDDRKEEVNSGLLTGMGLRKAACVIIDTTPLGFDDDYYPMMMEAADDNPKWIHRLENTVQLTAQDVFDGKIGEPDRPDGWVPAFSTWFVHDEYCTRNENPRGEWPRINKVELNEFLADLGKNSKYAEGEEQELFERGVSPYRLYWRRRKIDSIKQPSQELKLLVFRQEFASTVASSFVQYDKSPFDRECLDAVVRQTREPLATGIMREEGGKLGIDTTFHSDWQELRIYDGPRSSEQYAIGVDTGIRYAALDSDAWVAQILRGSDFSIVATYEARVDDFTFLEQLMYLYRFYNHAYTAVELQGSGYALVRRLIDAGMRNYYCWKRMDAEIPEPTKYPGWETTIKTRPIMDDWLVTTICHRDPMTNKPEPLVIIPDKKTLMELQSVKRQTSGAIKAAAGHDDHVDALALAMIAAADPWSGINNPFKAAREKPEEKKESNFAMFAGRWRGQSLSRGSRNRPDLAAL
jgi:hypothetical protein